MSKNKLVTGILVSLFILFALNRTIFFKPGLLERASAVLTYPVLWLSSTVSQHAQKILSKKQTYQKLSKNYQELQKRYDALFAEFTKLRATARYDKLTQELLDFQKRYELPNALLAKVLTKNLSSEEHTIVINRGTYHGIEKDMIAIYKLQIIGKVTDVFDFYSKIILITDDRCPRDHDWY